MVFWIKSPYCFTNIWLCFIWIGDYPITSVVELNLEINKLSQRPYCKQNPQHSKSSSAEGALVLTLIKYMLVQHKHIFYII